MAYRLNEEELQLVKQLVTNLSKYEEGSNVFAYIENHLVSKLQHAGTLLFANHKDIERSITGLCDKFMFHGLFEQADYLRKLSDKYLQSRVSKSEFQNRLNVLRFLICMAERPTDKSLHFKPQAQAMDEEDVIDWGSYLKEGIERWSPPPNDSSSTSSNDESEIYPADNQDERDGKWQAVPRDKHYENEQVNNAENFDIISSTLASTVQCRWFNGELVRMLPECPNADVNIGIYWDEFLEDQTKGLVQIQSNVISEYKVMREILWQFWARHSCSSFRFVGNQLVPQSNITIASVRNSAFENFLREFVRYIDLLQRLRDFHDSLHASCEEPGPPHTYRSYASAQRNILAPVMESLQELELSVKTQESSMTLLSLLNKVRNVFKSVEIVEELHKTVALNYKEHSRLQCATNLLSSLNESLLHVTSKAEQDVCLALYLESLYKYLSIVDCWLGEDSLMDDLGEFVILDENSKEKHMCLNNTRCHYSSTSFGNSHAEKGQQDWQMEFVIAQLDERSKSDEFIRTICNEVLQISKNIHLLRLLRKLHLINTYSETIYDELLRKVLKNISSYFNTEEIDKEMFAEAEEVREEDALRFPATYMEECQHPSELDKLENLVDVSNGFLMNAFESFFVQKPAPKAKTQVTLFQRIGRLTKALFPAHQIVQNAFKEILRERYEQSGQLIKGILSEDYRLEKHMQLLQHFFLFKDDIIFPFYRRLFEQIDADGKWGNHMSLTTHVQDIFMDHYPDLCEKCTVLVKDNWKLCKDPLRACNLIQAQYKIKWPINIFIRDEHMEMYEEIFRFILKMKWALFTLNHLYFTDLMPKKVATKTVHISLRKLLSRLKVLKFSLVNEFSSVQHYVFGYVFSKYTTKFETEFGEANSLDTIKTAHQNFIESIYKRCAHLRDFNANSHGFNLLLYLVRKLRIMWKNVIEIDDKELGKCERIFQECHVKINPIIYPQKIYLETY